MADPCTERALKLLTRRPHFRRELEQKLGAKGFEPEAVEATVARMVELRYLDEESAVRSFVEQKLRRGPVGRRRLEADLGRRGADQEVAREVLDEILADDDREAALEAGRRYTRGRRRDKAAVARHLERKGFSPRAIFSALDALEADLRADDPAVES